MRSQYIFYTLSVILIVQLVLLRPDFAFPHIAIGDFSQALKKNIVSLSPVSRSTELAAVRSQNFDSVVFTGDVMLGRNVEFLMDTEGSDYPYRSLPLTALSSNAAIVGNFESSMAPVHRETKPLEMRFSVDETHIDSLRAAGFTHLSLANNHSLDYGSEGYANAFSILSKYGMKPFGHGVQVAKNSVELITVNERKIALIGINTTNAIPSRDEITQLFSQTRAVSDMQIVYIHWGDEYEKIHSESQELFAKELVVAGADLIVGHHPHVVQDVDLIGVVPVFYSLGNYIFDQYFSPDVKEGLVLFLTFESEPAVHLIPVDNSVALSQPSPMNKETAEVFLNSLAERSHPQLSSAIRSNIIYLNDFVASSSKMAIMVR